jgi:glycosyltransferase involved in cell wall biosynthesis
MHQPVWVISEIYYPDENGTGHILTRIAEGLAQTRPVRVLCGQPMNSARGVRAPRHEVRNNVEIERCSSTVLDKNNLALRLINALTISASVFFKTLLQVQPGQTVMVVTSPPLLPYVVAVACRLRRTPFVLIAHDIYPEALTATGLLGPKHPIVRLMGAINRQLFLKASHICVLGRDMEQLLLARAPEAQDRISLIPNWGDTDIISPEPKSENKLLAELGLQEKFVVLYAGNLGRTHAVDVLVEAATQLQDDNIHFLFVGTGARKGWLDNAVAERHLKNVTVLGSRPRSEQQTFLNAADVSVVSFVPGMAGISVPSRMYNLMSAGKPIVAVCDAHSELAQVVQEEHAGWVVEPDCVPQLVATLRGAARNPEMVAEFGRNARAAVEEKYELGHALDQYHTLLCQLADDIHPGAIPAAASAQEQ